MLEERESLFFSDNLAEVLAGKGGVFEFGSFEDEHPPVVARSAFPVIRTDQVVMIR